MANKPYENFVIEDMIEDMLITRLDLNQFLTPDTSLTESAGMKKKIHRYYATGNVEDLAMGEGNSEVIEAGYTNEEYEVKVTQGKAIYYDEEEMQDPKIVETLTKGQAEIMTNDFTTKAIAEMGKATLYQLCDFATTDSGYLFGVIADAIAAFGENEDGLFILISPDIKAYFRKALADDLKYSEAYVRTGYIGTVCGVPVYVTKAVSGDAAYIATREAVTAFIKRGIELERERDGDHRKNTLYIRKVALVALTNATKVVKLVKTAPDAPTATVSPASVTVAVGAKTSLTATGVDGVAAKWTSSDDTVATVSPAGVVKGIKAGTATITATYTLDGKDYTATSAITVA